MSLPQQKFREIVFQLLYSQDVGRANAEDVFPLIMAELSVTKKAIRDAQSKVEHIKTKLKEIDSFIAQTSQSYEFERIQSVERNILRLGIFELLYDHAIPPKVAIAESMRLARKFGTPESGGFINAILDNVFKSSKGLKIDDVQINKSIQELVKSEEIAKEASQQQKEQLEEIDLEEID